MKWCQMNYLNLEYKNNILKKEEAIYHNKNWKIKIYLKKKLYLEKNKLKILLDFIGFCHFFFIYIFESLKA